jgi:hypothetical protein
MQPHDTSSAVSHWIWLDQTTDLRYGRHRNDMKRLTAAVSRSGVVAMQANRQGEQSAGAG